MKVTIIDSKTGRERVMEERFAKVLVGMKKATYLTAAAGTYQTRDMQAAAPVAVEPPAAAEPIVSTPQESPATAEEEFDDVTEARSMSDTQEPGVMPRRRGRPRKDAE